MKAWTNTLTLAAMAATLTLAAACTEDGPANMTEAEPETLEAFDSETIYWLRENGPQRYRGRPAYYTPQFYRFENDFVRQRFLAEVLPPLPLGWVRTLQPFETPGVFPFVDVRLNAEGRLETELVSRSDCPRLHRCARYRWNPTGAQEKPGGDVWTH